MVFGNLEDARAKTWLQNRRGAGEDVCIGCHLLVVVWIPFGGFAGKGVARRQTVAQMRCHALVHDRGDGATISVARIFAIEKHHMRVGSMGPIPSHRKAGDQLAHFHLTGSVDVGHLMHDQVSPALLHDIAFVAELLEVGIKTEQCG